ncbi:hypothetical protein C8R44DRAFT_980621 [Mycena epipterygia]|nr:hypothetical protein C8R44DRAFT_980621 [Mycena epipterygia]
MSDAVTIVIDDTALLNQPDNFVGDTGGWFTTDSSALDQGFPSNYNDTNFSEDSTPFGQGALLLSFEGISVSLFGITPPAQFNQTFGIGNSALGHVNLSDPKNYTSFKYPVPSHGGQFYTSGMLAGPEKLTIGITGARGLAVDYALVTIGESTVLRGQTILVDDSSPEIIWNGNWTVKKNYTLPVPCELALNPRSDTFTDFTANMTPHGNSSRFSSVVGDSFTFHFAGTSILVSGITPGDDQGLDWVLGMNFTLDENTTTTTFLRDSAYISKPHFTYFTSHRLKSGNHTLVAKIINVAGSQSPRANIDYITYTPSFLTLHDKPDFGASLANTTTQIPGQPSNTPSPTVAPRSGRTQSHAGAIAGGVLGGCCVMLLVVWLVWRTAGQRKRRSEQRLMLAADPFNEQQPSMISGEATSRSEKYRAPGLQISARSPPTVDVMQNEGRPQSASPSAGENNEHTGDQTLADQVRELQSLTRELRSHIVPPLYEGID